MENKFFVVFDGFKGLGEFPWVPRGLGDHSEHKGTLYDGIWLHFCCVFDDRSLERSKRPPLLRAGALHLIAVLNDPSP